MCNLIIKMNIAFALVGYEMIITNSMVHLSLAIYHLTHIHPVLMELSLIICWLHKIVSLSWESTQCRAIVGEFKFVYDPSGSSGSLRSRRIKGRVRGRE